MKIYNPFKKLNKFEWCLWIFSLAAVTAAFFGAGSTDYAAYATSMIGTSALIFTAKGDPFGLFIMLSFCVIYAVVSFFAKFYGEVIIYSCMQIPIVCVSIAGWLKNPAKKGSSEVKIGKLTPIYGAVLAVSAVAVAVAFFFILRAFNTNNLWVSTLSVVTSFVALYLMFFRVPAYALAFMLNDVVLITLWSFECTKSLSYLPLVICFAVFLINDCYGYINWQRRKKLQKQDTDTADLPEQNQTN